MFSFSGDLGFLVLFFIMCGFLVSVTSVLNFLLLCEVIWIGLYFSCSVYGSWLDSLIFCLWGVLFLCLATSETVVGLGLVIFKGSVDSGVKEFSTTTSGEEKGSGFSKFWSSSL